MKPNQSLFCCTALSAALLLTSGCQKSGERVAEENAPITGRPSDPPVEMKAQWKAGQRYAMHMEMSQSGQMPWGRGTGGQESSLGQDYAVTVTDAPGGGRALDLEILSFAAEAGAGKHALGRLQNQRLVALADLALDGFVAGIGRMA